jgi:pilus assembly protein Flp/PilA
MTKSDTRSPAAGQVPARQVPARQVLARFYGDESGATSIEYAMIASGVGAVVAATVYLIGNSVKNMFTTLSGLFP